MPAAWRFESGVLVFSFTGEYTLQDLENVFAEAICDPRFSYGNTELLFDGRASQEKLPRDVVEARIAWVSALPLRVGVGRAAIVAGTQLHRYGIARQMQLRLEAVEFELKVFTEYDEALHWLLLPRR